MADPSKFEATQIPPGSCILHVSVIKPAASHSIRAWGVNEAAKSRPERVQVLRRGASVDKYNAGPGRERVSIAPTSAFKCRPINSALATAPVIPRKLRNWEAMEAIVVTWKG